MDLLTGSLGFEVEEFLGDILGGLVGDGAPEEDLTVIEKLFLDEHGDGRGGFFGDVVGLLVVVIFVVVEAGKGGVQTGLEMLEMHMGFTLRGVCGLASAQAKLGGGGGGGMAGEGGEAEAETEEVPTEHTEYTEIGTGRRRRTRTRTRTIKKKRKDGGRGRCGGVR